jgi:hypothetical protein
MEIAAKLAMFTAGLALAVTAGWGLGQVIGELPLPLVPGTDSLVTTHDHSGAPPATRNPEDR